MSLHPRLVILASQLGLHFTCEGRVNSPQVAPSEFFPRVRCGFVLRVDIDEPTGFGSLAESSVEGNNRRSGVKSRRMGRKLTGKVINMHAPQMLMVPVRRYACGVESNKNQKCCEWWPGPLAHPCERECVLCRRLCSVRCAELEVKCDPTSLASLSPASPKLTRYEETRRCSSHVAGIRPCSRNRAV
ncbi:hypothetical protein CTAM01_10691 [Colletotrichum tamarilloi]|uniref:Uncharacterized protein n=1 Tax=Colletotrichum tamarilloi TaxID=1209934 RepID=A0ABQ9QZQ2_9PEZI|nr:uncharacterized protein CTAM01_10691 [Colletotrichum tamarilloi]KAK1490402.1 hypothetical protein CTAM01_10691 [Colletotrichum tamarilloi]